MTEKTQIVFKKWISYKLKTPVLQTMPLEN